MDTNTKTLQINTFSKGMDTDTSDALLHGEAYRLANNLRYITDTDENSGELHLIEGSTEIESLVTNIDTLLSSKQITNWTIREVSTIRNYGILIIENETKWCVVTIDTVNGNTLKFVFGPCTEKLSSTNKLSLVTNWENNLNVKLYIADGEHKLITINLVDPNVYTTLDSITNSGISLSSPEILSTISGTLKPALIGYSYLLYNKNGVLTNMSTTTKFYKVNKTANGIVEGVPQDNISSVGFKIRFKLNNKFNNILIFRISYVLNGLNPSIELIYDDKYTSGDVEFILDDWGRESIKNITIEEYSSYSGILFSPSIIEVKNGYLFAANIDYQSSKYYNDIINWDARVFTAGDEYDGQKVLSYEDNEYFINQDVLDDQTINFSNPNLNLSQPYDVLNWEYNYLLNLQSLTALGGIGKNIKYKLITRQVIIDDRPDDKNTPIYKENISNYVDPIKAVNYKSLRRDEIYRYGIILYSEDGYKFPVKWVTDVRTPAINVIANEVISNLSYWSGFRLLFEIKTESESNVKKLYANVLGIEFSITNLPQGCSGYEIVRCNRTLSDKATITQGIVSSLYGSIEGNPYSEQNKKHLFPTGIVTAEKINFVASWPESEIKVDDNILSSKTNSEYLQLFSPEICYQPDDIESLSKNITHINPIAIIKPYKITKNEYTNFNTYSPALNICYGLTEYKISSPTLLQFEQSIIETNQSLFFPNSLVLDDRNRLSYVKLYDSFSSQYEYLLELPQQQDEPNVLICFIDQDININEIKINKTVPAYNSFITSGSNPQFEYDRNVIAMQNGYIYCPWKFPQSFQYISLDLLDQLGSDTYHMSNTNSIGTSDKSAIIQIDKPTDLTNSELYYLNYRPTTLPETNYYFRTFICNLRSDVTVPYNGNSYLLRTNSLYYGHGQYFDTTDNVCDVFDGDCFIQCFEFVPLHQWDHPTLRFHANETIIYSVPLETDIDIVNDYGSRYSRIYNQNNANLLQDQPTNFSDLFIQTKPLYAYNTAYNAEQTVNINSGIDLRDEQTTKYDYRIHYSNLKENNEITDSWSIFLPLNYLDVDTRYGQITELRTFGNQLLFWLEHAMGMLSVNERTLITDDSNLPLILGTGGVLARYDYVSTKNGMYKNQFVDTQSDSTLYWWDYNNHELCAYVGNQMIVLSKAKFVLNFINKQTRLDDLTELNKLNDKPLLIFDKQYNEILCNITNGDDKEAGSLVYNEQLQQFTGLYNINPEFLMTFFDLLWLIKNNNVLFNKWNSSNGSTSVGFRNTPLYPYLKYVINDNSTYTKVYDTMEFGGRFYGGNDLTNLSFTFRTPLKQESRLEDGSDITNRQYEFKVAIPRAGKIDSTTNEWVTNPWGDRMRGKTMQCEMSSNSNSLDFSLQYIITKYRISWS